MFFINLYSWTTNYVKFFDWSVLSSIYQYFFENITCLLYGIEVLPYQAMYFTSYFSLVIDIAEAYGSWVALLFVFMSTLLTMVAVEQVLLYSNNYFKLGGKSENANNINNVSADKFFFTFNFFKFFNKK